MAERCESQLELENDSDNVYTAQCDLPVGHEGMHVETGTTGLGAPYVMAWGDSAAQPEAATPKEKGEVTR